MNFMQNLILKIKLEKKQEIFTILKKEYINDISKKTLHFLRR